jgi:hypothetical protein
VEAFVFAWAFATIIPALLRTRSLFATFHFFDRTHPWKNFRFTPFWQAVSFVVGLGLKFIPVMFDACTQKTLNSCIPNIIVWMFWLGFIFMIEPINYRLALGRSTLKKARSVFSGRFCLRGCSAGCCGKHGISRRPSLSSTA